MLVFDVKGLGKIKNSKFNLSQFTVITGQNGTGKSFFTKSLYSIFSTIEKISTQEHINESIDKTINSLNRLIKYSEISDPTFLTSMIDRLKELQTNIDCKKHKNFMLEEKVLLEFNSEISLIKKEFNIYIETIDINLNKVVSTTVEYLVAILNVLDLFSTSLITSYQVLLQENITNEMRDNFQVQDISELVNFNSNKFEIKCDNLFTMSYNKDNSSISMSITSKSIDFFKEKPKSVFFESPVYWRVRDALIDAKMKSGDDYLSGVPKYFFDLDSALRLKSKSQNNYIDTYEEIKKELNGEFKIDGNELSFIENYTNNKISKNLVSFGMTNLGMLNTLIYNNVINSGSYVFIDEPETNLHPDWQILMIKSLISLSNAGVNVVINTHSIEILKFIEVYFKKIKQEIDDISELLSVNYLDVDGTMFDFESTCPYENIKEARVSLTSSYFDIYMDEDN